MMDEVFGRGNFVSNVIWQKKFSPQNDAKWISNSHDHVHCYALNKNCWFPNPLPRSTAMDERFKNPDNDPRGPWSATDLTRAEHRDRDYWGLVTPSGKTVYPAKGRSWSRPKENIEKLVTDERLWFGPNGSNLPRLKKFLSEMDGGLTPQSIWLHSEVGNNQEAKKEILQLDSETVFDTPKPERLLQRVLHLATNPGDLVLDSFLGSGTTAAVAHKMGRHWIGIEMGEHATTHCVPRLLKVIDGEQGGISAAVGWQGGGGFQLLQLGAPLFDEQGDIHPEVRFADLAAFIWMRETGTALPAQAASGTLPLLGVHEGTAYYLLFNGILGDRRPASGNVLTTAVLQALNELCGHDGPKVIYGEACRLGDARLKAEGISFKQLPHAVPR
jgi:adenine-specific DNA-methyltransferase